MLEYIVDVYGVVIYEYRISNKYKWFISNKYSVLKFIYYIKIYPCISMKKNNILHFLPKIFELKYIYMHIKLK